MGQERPASWFDERIRASGLHEMELEELPTASLLKEIGRQVPPESRVVDVGSRCGHMAEVLRRHGVTEYLGFDFAPTAVEAAERRAPWAWFVNIDVRRVKFPHADLFLFVDVLENIWDDVEVVNSVPSDSRLIVSVPREDGPARVAHFPELDDATSRYRDVMTIDEAYTYEDDHHILTGRS